MSERTIDEEQIRDQHLREVNPLAQWAYLVGVLLGGTVLMLALIAVLGSTSG
jgi:hypothetical protein